MDDIKCPKCGGQLILRIENFIAKSYKLNFEGTVESVTEGDKMVETEIYCPKCPNLDFEEILSEETIQKIKTNINSLGE